MIGAQPFFVVTLDVRDHVTSRLIVSFIVSVHTERESAVRMRDNLQPQADAFFSRLREPRSSVAFKRAQENLIQRGHALLADNIWGEASTAAVRIELQKAGCLDFRLRFQEVMKAAVLGYRLSYAVRDAFDDPSAPVNDPHADLRR